MLATALTTFTFLIGCNESTPDTKEKNPEAQATAPIAEENTPVAKEDAPVKDARYYFDHIEELKPILIKCKAKIDAITKSTEIPALYDDKECAVAGTAAFAISVGDWKKGILSEPYSEGKYSNNWEYKLYEAKVALERWESIENHPLNKSEKE